MADEYIRKSDAVDVIEKEMKNYASDIWYKSAIHSALNDVNEGIKSLEPADVVQVVRCDDCVYYGSRRWCELHSSVFDDNAFCSYGERREE